MFPFVHYLTFSRPSPVKQAPIVADAKKLAVHDFDVDIRSGFMPPEPPVDRLPGDWELWEAHLDEAIASRFKPGDHVYGVRDDEAAASARWRARIDAMPILKTSKLSQSEVLLRRARVTLTFLLQYYVHSQPPAPATEPIRIPPSIAVPLLSVSRELDLPPISTYSDVVLYNWRSSSSSTSDLRPHSLFTSTPDEEHFYLTSHKIELKGVEALELMRNTLDEMYLSDALALRRISGYLRRLAVVITDLTQILDNVKKGCDPGVFYRDIRPWFRGEEGRRWMYMGEDGKEIVWDGKRELSGSSAGQSSLIHALDIFLGVDHASAPPRAGSDPNFLKRMQSYMPRHHRRFLSHLRSNPRTLRSLIIDTPSAGSSKARLRSLEAVKEGYNEAVLALKSFRDAHIRIATLYVISQARAQRPGVPPISSSGNMEGARTRPRGTGGTDLVPFLKTSRDDTARALV